MTQPWPCNVCTSEEPCNECEVFLDRQEERMKELDEKLREKRERGEK